MNKYYVIGAGVFVALVIGAFALFYNPCKEPMEVTVAVQGLKCTLGYLNQGEEVIIADLCEYLKRGENCELTFEDQPKAVEMIDTKIISCVKENLEKENYCTDKVEQILKRDR